jgi:hypothetical protein
MPLSLRLHVYKLQRIHQDTRGFGGSQHNSLPAHNLLHCTRIWMSKTRLPYNPSAMVVPPLYTGQRHPRIVAYPICLILGLVDRLSISHACILSYSILNFIAYILRILGFPSLRSSFYISSLIINPATLFSAKCQMTDFCDRGIVVELGFRIP